MTPERIIEIIKEEGICEYEESPEIITVNLESLRRRLLNEFEKEKI